MLYLSKLYCITGDHGGESKAERTAALFAYRKAGLAGDLSDVTLGKEVQQTDLAPTMSAALGRPPPAPSLGNLLLPVLPKYSIPHTLLHISNNLKQVRNRTNFNIKKSLLSNNSDIYK